MKTPVSESFNTLDSGTESCIRFWHAPLGLREHAIALACMASFGMGRSRMKLPRKLGKEPLIEAIARSSAVRIVNRFFLLNVVSETRTLGERI